MEVKILHEDNNPLFNRKEIRFEVVHKGETTPKLSDVKRVVANKTGSDASHVIIDGFKTLFGIGRTIGDARIYKKMDELKDYEPTYLLKRNGLITEEKKEEAAEAPAEAPKETPKEEKPAETPKKEAPKKEKEKGEK